MDGSERLEEKLRMYSVERMTMGSARATAHCTSLSDM